MSIKNIPRVKVIGEAKQPKFSMYDLIVIAGAPGSGKTTTADLIHAKLQSSYIEFSSIREFHLDREWLNQSEREEQMSFENLICIIKNYFRYGYKNIIVTDLKYFRVQQIPEVFADFNFLIATIIINNDDELAMRIRRRNSGFQNIERALEWNKEIQVRPLLNNAHRIDTTHNEPHQTAEVVLQKWCGKVD